MNDARDAQRLALSVRDLHLHSVSSARRRTLVRDVRFDVEPGRTLAIVGESGSGKSLTAKSIVGLLPPGVEAEGSIRYGDQELIGAEPKLLRSVRGAGISLLLQDPFTMLNPLLTVRAHLVESLAERRRSRTQTQDEVHRRLAEVSLPADVADKYPFQLSGGMRQRVALATALAKDPQLLIADEPTTALDVTTQAEILALLKRVQDARGMSLIFITHDLRVAFAIADRVQVMYAGSVVEQAPTADLEQAPSHPYSLGLITAEPPIEHYVSNLNSIPGSVPRADDVTHRCAFSDRCRWAMPACGEGRPELKALDASRTSACIRIDEIAPELAVARAESTQADQPPPVTIGDPLLVCDDLVKTYSSVRLFGAASVTTALGGVSFTIGDGESVGLVGETGSGKSTIARCLLGLTQRDAGRLVLDGIDVSDYRALSRADRLAARRCVQMVFQDPYASLNPRRTIGSILDEALSFAGAAQKKSGGAERLLRRVGLPEAYAARKPAALSGGERQRVAIARAIAVNPRLLVCDEPVAALDVSAQAQILQLLRDIRYESGMSMLFITHDLSVVRQVADRVIVLYRGQLVESGTTGQILDEPSEDYTRQLVAASAGSVPALHG